MLTTNPSGTSISSAFMNWIASPPWGWTTSQVVSAIRTTSISPCPTPTVSTNTVENSRASSRHTWWVTRATPPVTAPEAWLRKYRRSSSGGNR